MPTWRYEFIATRQPYSDLLVLDGGNFRADDIAGAWRVLLGMTPPHPGAFIREEILDDLGLTVGEAAKVLDVRRATLSDLITGNAALSAEMALRIEKAFGVKMETLLNMQAWHDAHIVRQREGEIAVKRYRPSVPEP